MEEKNFNLDLSNYYSYKIYLDFNSRKGLSIKAKEFINKGELIIAEKAFIEINDNSKKTYDYFSNTGTKSILDDDILTYNFLLEAFKNFLIIIKYCFYYTMEKMEY